ncbi:hypothetical protein HPP92_020431 [Vanilla planifolia]|nr:hypothetical protein HPP92_020431 [Vanilla planifolia]
MSTSMVFCVKLLLLGDGRYANVCRLCGASGFFEFSSKRKRVSVYRLVPAAKRNHARKRPWWESLFSEEDDDVLSIWKGVDVLGDTEEVEEVSCDEKFESWKRRAEAITELKDAQEDARNAESREWEDWIG